MAVRATFLADFSGFEQALAGARSKIVFLESDADKVSKSLGRMTESFSGKRIVQDANLAVRAVNDLGGVSQLTAGEQARLNATVTEALAKYKALGQEAPAELLKVSKELNAQTLSWKDLALAAGAIAGVVAGASAAIGKLGERGAGVNDVREQFKTLTEAVGETSEAILGELKRATLGTISDFELMKTVNLGMSQGLNLTAENFGLLGDTAAVLADRTGGDLKTAFDTLTAAMTTGQDRTLKTIGLNIDAEKAQEKYAAAIGKTRGELEEHEKIWAIQNAVLEEGRNILAASGKAQEDFGDKVGQSSAKMSNFIDRIGAWIATSPSIGAWTSTITAAASSITAVGFAYAPLAAGFTKLGPLVTGLTGVWATLGTTITVTVIPALGTAFALISPFLIPLGLLAAAIGAVYLAWKYWDEIVAFFKGAWNVVVDAVKAIPDLLAKVPGPIGAVAIAFKNWDKIAALVKAVYDAIKTWMVDKFNAVVDSIKKKVDQVTGFFKDMYDKVVGHSYVPDLIEGIGREFGMLNDKMVRPTEQATRTAGQYFKDFATNAVQTIGKAFGNMLTGATSFKDGFIGIWKGLKGLLGDVLGDILTNVIGGFVKQGTEMLGGLSFSGGGTGVSGGGGGEFGGQQIPSFDLLKVGVDLAKKGITAISNHLKGGEEGMFVNPRRDAFMLQFGAPGFGENSGFYALANLLNSFGRGDLFDVLRGADKVDTFETAEQIIADLLGKNGLQVRTFETGGMVPGSGSVPAILHGGERVLNRAETADYNAGGMSIGEAHFHISGAGQNGRQIAEEAYAHLIALTRRNYKGGRTGMRNALGVT